MPEVSEIAILSQYLTTKLKGKIITKLEIISGKYKTKKELVGKKLLKGTKHYKVINVKSKGKLMWIIMHNVENSDDKIYMTSHLGLAGEWSFYKSENDRIRLYISHKGKKYNLCYTDPRNFGNIEIYDDEDEIKEKIDRLAPDALKYDFSDDEFIEMVKNFLVKSKTRSNQLIYKVLMNQTIKDGIVCGLGNYLTAEILYDAKISPFRMIGSLSDNEIRKISHSIKYLTKLSYYNNITGYMTGFGDFISTHKERVDSGIYSNFHSEIKLKKKDEFVFKVYRQKKDPLGNPVVGDRTINKDRTTYWVPNVQK